MRQGAAGAIATVDTLGPDQAAVADVSIALAVNDAAAAAVPVRLRGPADVVGIDAHQVVRTDPRPGTSDFEPNCFPSIEFDRADFPWLFTPARANANAQLRPWLCLVVVRKQDGVQLASTRRRAAADAADRGAGEAVRRAARSEGLLGLGARAGGGRQAPSNPNAVGDALNGAPQLSLSRLVCPRLLAPNTDYIACVVPTFELGRKAGLGLPIADADLTAANALAPAWTLTATAPLQVQLPVYYSWEFRTGAGRRLRVAGAAPDDFASPTGLGQRTVDIGAARLPAARPRSRRRAAVKVEGALMPLTGSDAPGALVRSGRRRRSSSRSRTIVNQPGLNQVIAPTANPLLAPPLYGRWHAGARTVHARRGELVRRAESRSALARRPRRSARRSFRSIRKR